MTIDIKQATENYIQSYKKAVTLGADSTKSTREVASAITAHYGPGFTSFTSGHIAANGSSDNETAKCTLYLDFLKRSGLGTCFSLERFRIEVVSKTSALCYATWSIAPVDGRDGWEWENVYGYRRLVNKNHDGAQAVEAEGYWEFVVSDNELNSIVERVPTIFDDMFGSAK